MPIVTQTVPVYSQEEQRAIRLNTCKKCIYAKCNGNEANKCNIDTLKCSLNDKFIVPLANNLSSTCPKKYWDGASMTKKIDVNVSGCGCGG